MPLAVPKSEKFTKKLDTLFAKWRFLFLFKWLVYMFLKTKGLKICKTILQKSFGAWGCL